MIEDWKPKVNYRRANSCDVCRHFQFNQIYFGVFTKGHCNEAGLVYTDGRIVGVQATSVCDMFSREEL